MPRPTIRSVLPLLLLLAGCAGPGHAPASPAPLLGGFLPPDDAAREMVDRERWGAPFAVQSAGRAARPETRVVVLEAAPASSRTRTASRPTSRAPAAVPPVSARTHRVEWGDTWFSIARRYQVSRDALAAVNPGVEPARLRSGQVLRIPGGADPAPGTGQRTHRVGPGDTLWGIAHRYGVSLERIRAVNRLPDERVHLGAVLIIP